MNIKQEKSNPYADLRNIGFWIVLLILLSACSAPAETGAAPTESQPTSIPTLTQTVFVEQQPSPTSTQQPALQEPSPTPQVTSVIRTPIPDFTLTQTPTPISWVEEETEFPEAAIKIISPGHLSRVVSPFNISVDMIPGYLGRVRIELIGEDGEELVRRIETPINWRGTGRVDFIREIEFEIEGLVEYARLQISIDDEYGRTTQLASVDLFLMSEGVAEVFPGTETTDKIIIQHPIPNLTIFSNYLIITGLAKPASDKPLVVEVISDEGKYLATGLAPVIVPEGETWGLFAAEINLDLEETQRVLIVVRERGSRIPGNAAISSVEVLISP